MSQGIELGLLGLAGMLVIGGSVSLLRGFRGLLWGSAALALITAVYPRPDNHLATVLGLRSTGSPDVISEFLGIAWWLLGAWLIKDVLNHILRRTLFPNDNQPHSRKLFADLAACLIYIAAFVGIMNTVLGQPISTVLATSGVAAVVLGLALQNTLADVFSGLALNIERPFKSGDWITVSPGVEGQVIEINWRATRIKTLANDTVIIPNSVIAKAPVTNHERRADPHFCSIDLSVEHAISPSRVIDILQHAAADTSCAVAGFAAFAYAGDIRDTTVCYQLSFPIDDFSQAPRLRSEIIGRVTHLLAEAGPSAVQ